jgi:GlcNAc-P-P-Und epimerase
MKYLVTGGTGFLGRYIVDFLQSAGNEVFITTRNPIEPNHIKADFEKGILEFPAGNNVTFDYVIHAAGKAHIVPKTDPDRQAFFNVNVAGTKLLLDKLGQLASLPKGFVFISSVSVYGRDSGTDITENEPLNATDPYGKSKIETEKLILDWGSKNNVTIGIARLPLIAGKNPPGNLGKMINGIKGGKYFRIGAGSARKSMVWAGDIAAIMPKLAQTGGIYNFTDGYHPAFAELEDAITAALGLQKVKRFPLFFAKIAAGVGSILEKLTGKKMPVNNLILSKIINPLTFSDVKAGKELNWNPTRLTDHIKEIVA